MARLEMKVIPKDDQTEALKAITAYKKQNPTKYESKKAALFARYGLDVEDVIEPEDEADKELKALAEKVAKKSKTTK